jgi:hypothetical protein
MPDDPYAILEVEQGATDAEIKAAYRRLAAMYHPDRNPGFQEAANEKLKALNDAYDRVRAARRDDDDSTKERTTDREPTSSSGGRNHDEPSGARPDHQTVIAMALADVGFLRDADRDHPIVEIVASIVPDGARMFLCVPSTVVPAGNYGFEELRRTFLRKAPAVGFGGVVAAPSRSAGPAARTEIVVCTAAAMVWTSSHVTDADGVVVQEHVTAYSLAFENILGSRVTSHRKGTVDVWVLDGPTLTFRTAPHDAEVLSAYVSTAAASH